MFISVLETTNFTFFGSGFTEKEATNGLRVAWEKHSRSYEVDLEYGNQLIDDEEFSMIQFPVGQGSPSHGKDDATPDNIPIHLDQFTLSAAPTGATIAATSTLLGLNEVLSDAQQVSVAFRAFQDGTLKMGVLADIIDKLAGSINANITPTN